jgi:teichuronic acid biosynthesis glycosyltransferase TuaH
LLFYDFNDSPFQFSTTPAWAADYWRRTRDEADAFFVVSEYYRRQLLEQTARPLIVIGNGVEMDHFEPPRAVPPDLDRLPRPRIGYLGLLSHFLDFETLEALRQARRGGTLVLIGPDTPETAAAVRAFAAREGVRWLGPKAYADVPAYMQGLDVGVIPFRAADPHVQGINPNKVYQYLASGLPVITTPVLDLEPAPPHLTFATDPAAMRLALERVLETPRECEACRSLARPHDWSHLARRMVAEIEQRRAAA